MATFDDALRGYARRILERDGFRCRYCGLDGSQSFSNWLALTWDHLLPRGHPKRHDEDYIVAACSFCNTADNRYLEKAEAAGFGFDGRTPDELVALRRKAVQKTRDSYREFWKTNVQDGEQGGVASHMDESAFSALPTRTQAALAVMSNAVQGVLPARSWWWRSTLRICKTRPRSQASFETSSSG